MASTNTLSDSRVWFITGSSQGLGRTILDAILAAGERAVATLRTPSALADLQAKYPSSQLLIQPLDVVSPTQIKEAFETTKKHFNRLDVVVNNAGYGLFGEIEATPDEEARAQIEVLFWGPVNITREVNPQGHGGRIFNISSGSGYQANPNLAFYSAGKFALEAFNQSFIKEMPLEWNIKGCIIKPGGTRTSWSGSLNYFPQHPACSDLSFPTSVFRASLGTIPGVSDPVRAAQIILDLAKESDLPLRLQLGSDSFYIVESQAKQTLKDQEKWAKVSHSANADDYDSSVISLVLKLRIPSRDDRLKPETRFQL
ncbi:NAD(P)-binding protein [Ramaria rubella]|nr:NAD(P)-binding protein [Ramaria rubella]